MRIALLPTYAVCRMTHVVSLCSFQPSAHAFASCFADINSRGSHGENSRCIFHGMGRSITIRTLLANRLHPNALVLTLTCFRTKTDDKTKENLNCLDDFSQLRKKISSFCRNFATAIQTISIRSAESCKE